MLHGFQCWINLPAAHKMDPPAYKDLLVLHVESKACVASQRWPRG